MNPYFRFTSSLTLLISVVFLSGCSSDSNTTPPTDSTPSLQEQLKIIVDDAVESGLPGVSLHVQSQGENINAVAGLVNKETAEPVTPTSLFHAASIGKTFTSTMFMRLVDLGMLQLEDPVERWLDPSMSAMITNSESITVEMLLAHTSGIPDYFSNPDFFVAFSESPGKIWTPIEIMGYVDGAENLFEPGSEFRYSNTNYVLLGVIAERVTGVSLGIALRQWVLEPAGLANTFGAFENLGQPETARGYVPVSELENSGLNIDFPMDGSDLDTTEWLVSEGLGDAPIHSTPSDLNLFIRTLIDTDTLVTGELKTRMLTESFPGSSEHGLGVYITENGLTFEHDGKGFGLRSWMAYTPSEDWSFATTVNGTDGNYTELFNQYLTRVYMALDRQE